MEDDGNVENIRNDPNDRGLAQLTPEKRNRTDAETNAGTPRETHENDAKGYPGIHASGAEAFDDLDLEETDLADLIDDEDLWNVEHPNLGKGKDANGRVVAVESKPPTQNGRHEHENGTGTYHKGMHMRRVYSDLKVNGNVQLSEKPNLLSTMDALSALDCVVRYLDQERGFPTEAQGKALQAMRNLQSAVRNNTAWLKEEGKGILLQASASPTKKSKPMPTKPKKSSSMLNLYSKSGVKKASTGSKSSNGSKSAALPTGVSQAGKGKQ